MNEATYWRQRYEMLMANFGDAIKAAGIPPQPLVLADKESYEAGRIAEREACAARADIALLGADRGLRNRIMQAIRESKS